MAQWMNHLLLTVGFSGPMWPVCHPSGGVAELDCHWNSLTHKTARLLRACQVPERHCLEGQGGGQYRKATHSFICAHSWRGPRQEKKESSRTLCTSVGLNLSLNSPLSLLLFFLPLVETPVLMISVWLFFLLWFSSWVCGPFQNSYQFTATAPWIPFLVTVPRKCNSLMKCLFKALLKEILFIW